MRIFVAYSYQERDRWIEEGLFDPRPRELESLLRSA